jgi:hypothetical protein
METAQTQRLREVAGEIFDYNPSFLREAALTTLGTILSCVGLSKLVVSKALNREEMTKIIEDRKLNVFPEDVIQLEPWYTGGGHMRAVAEIDSEKYVLCSFFGD